MAERTTRLEEIRVRDVTAFAPLVIGPRRYEEPEQVTRDRRWLLEVVDALSEALRSAALAGHGLCDERISRGARLALAKLDEVSE